MSVLLYTGRARTTTNLCLLAWAWKILRTWPRKNFGLCSGEFCWSNIITTYFLYYIVWHSNDIISILNINDRCRLKVLPMSDDIIFVLQTDSSLHCAVENVDILDSRPKVATLWSTNRDLCPVVSWAKATCKQRKDSILCHFHWIQIPPFIWSEKKFALGWWLLSLSQHLLLKVSYQKVRTI